MSLASITSDMEAIINDGFFSETIVHNYPTAQTENLTVIWDEPGSGGIDDRFESSTPSFQMKTSAMGNIVRGTSTFTKDGDTYKIIEIEDQQHGITKISV